MEPKTARACTDQGGIFPVLARVNKDKAITGIVEGTTVLTLDGALPIEHLNIGDRVITRTGMAVLRAIEVNITRCTPYRISPDTLGQGRPEDAVLLPAAQKVYIRDWRAQALFGRDKALARVDRLADGEYIAKQPERKMRVYKLVFDTPQVIYAGGLELASEEDIRIAA